MQKAGGNKGTKGKPSGGKSHASPLQPASGHSYQGLPSLQRRKIHPRRKDWAFRIGRDGTRQGNGAENPGLILYMQRFTRHVGSAACPHRPAWQSTHGPCGDAGASWTAWHSFGDSLLGVRRIPRSSAVHHAEPGKAAGHGAPRLGALVPAELGNPVPSSLHAQLLRGDKPPPTSPWAILASVFPPLFADQLPHNLPTVLSLGAVGLTAKRCSRRALLYRPLGPDLRAHKPAASHTFDAGLLETFLALAPRPGARALQLGARKGLGF